ncbi:hypothetical protein RCL_jg23997.t1 [Rhizophagus clarus]|uniref:Uncharacterized protein n=1 Tax=Rhizophagus clarus TaxID=94130 RepID=A0A8H3QPT7_9GLOM|nr:hypothetical protein RCL_jg23997.t1 [Rhizophagus clarus]
MSSQYRNKPIQEQEIRKKNSLIKIWKPLQPQSQQPLNIDGLEEEDEEVYNLLKNNSEFDVSQTSDYLNVIADVTTRWNSSFLAWQ